jgi:tRNA(adenine34) deaminase
MKPHCDWDCAIVAPSRRAFLAGLACAASSRSGAQAQSGAASANDVRFMRMAIEEARQADFPFGAVIVRDGSVIARGRNLGRTTGDPTAHGEMVAIRRCLSDHGSAALRAARSTPRANLARCAWARFTGAIWDASSLPPRLRNSPPRSIRS